MDILIELVVDLVFGGAVEASKSKKIPKPIRFILLLLILLFIIAVFGLLLFVGVSICIDGNIIGGIVIMLFTLLVLGFGIHRFIGEYLKKVESD